MLHPIRARFSSRVNDADAHGDDAVATDDLDFWIVRPTLFLKAAVVGPAPLQAKVCTNALSAQQLVPSDICCMRVSGLWSAQSAHGGFDRERSSRFPRIASPGRAGEGVRGSFREMTSMSVMPSVSFRVGFKIFSYRVLFSPGGLRVR